MSVSLVKISPTLQRLIDAGLASPVVCDQYGEHREHEAGTTDRYTSREPSYGETPCMYLVNGPTSGSDYSGDSCCESNQRSLYRDYPQFLIDLYGGHGTYGLAVLPTFGLDDADGHATGLVDDLVALQDYPLYDEQDESTLIDERADSAWDNYVQHDLQRTLAERFGAYEVTVSRELFDEVTRDHEIYPESEGHRDITYPKLNDDDTLIALWARIVGTSAVVEDDDPLTCGQALSQAARLNRYGYATARVGSWRLTFEMVMYPTMHRPVAVHLFDDVTGTCYSQTISHETLNHKTSEADRRTLFAASARDVAVIAGWSTAVADSLASL